MLCYVYRNNNTSNVVMEKESPPYKSKPKEAKGKKTSWGPGSPVIMETDLVWRDGRNCLAGGKFAVFL